MRVIAQVTDQGKYRYSLNQLFIAWQKPRARKVHGAQLRMTLAGLGLWLALFPPESPSPLTRLAPLIAEHLPARGLMWSLFVSLLIAFTPWSLIARPLPSRLPQALGGRQLPERVGLILKRLLQIVSWELPLAMTVIAGLWMLIQLTLQLTEWPLYWAPPSLALLPPLLLGLGARFDTRFLKTRASKARFVEQFQIWNRLHPLAQLLDKPRMQIPQPEFQGALYNEDVRKILIVDQDLTVDLLAKNGLHKRDSILLMSLQRYPDSTAKFARRILALHPEEVEVYVLHHERRVESQVIKQLRALGVTPRHKTLQIGWREVDLRRLIAHLGFQPVDWDVFAVDTLSPKSLLESVASAIATQIPIVRRLGSGGSVLPAPPRPKTLEQLQETKRSIKVSPSDPQLDAFLTPEPILEAQGKALQAASDEP